MQKEGPDAIKQAFAGLPDLNQCETLVDYGNVYHDHEELIDTQRICYACSEVNC